MLCSLCLFGIGESKPIALFINNEVTEIAKMIEQNELIRISREASNICQKCFTSLIDFYDFCNYVKERQFTLGNKESKADADLMIQQSLIIDIKSECLDDENDRAYDEGEDVNDGVNIKDEKVPLISPLSEAECYFDFTNIPADVKDTERDIFSTGVATEKKYEKIGAMRETKSPSAAESAKSPKKLKSKEIKRNSRATISDSEYDTVIAKHLSIQCDLCGAVEDTFLKLRKHYRTNHECEGYLKCCGKFFKKRLLLAKHIKLHLNSESLNCTICSRKMKSAQDLEKHMDDKHSPEQELKYKCDQCDKAFANKQNAKRHQEETHVIGHNYECRECNKCFKTKSGLSKHTKLKHRGKQKSYVCHICGRVFKFLPSFDRHLAEHQGIVVNVPTHQCDLCGEWFTRIGLNKHKDMHNKIDVKCDTCGKIHVSKTALRRHIWRHHKKVKILNCPYCEKTFKRNTALKEHIAIHTDQKNYVCQFCSKEFRFNATMYAHRKRDHPKEWELEKVANKKRPPVSTEQIQQ